ncbi:MAG: hypothetical protein H0W88_01315 [Parachlamydiaceae bacterium]|nr:hypothetical protein [Parachlamydiaceae bacterium]
MKIPPKPIQQALFVPSSIFSKNGKADARSFIDFFKKNILTLKNEKEFDVFAGHIYKILTSHEKELENSFFTRTAYKINKFYKQEKNLIKELKDLRDHYNFINPRFEEEDILPSPITNKFDLENIKQDHQRGQSHFNAANRFKEELTILSRTQPKDIKAINAKDLEILNNLKLAARCGHTPSLLFMGSYYKKLSESTDKPREYQDIALQLAIQYYLKAANNKIDPNEKEKMDPKAYSDALKAQARAQAKAQLRLGEIFEGQKDEIAAKKWYNKLISNGNKDKDKNIEAFINTAQRNLGNLGKIG